MVIKSEVEGKVKTYCLKRIGENGGQVYVLLYYISVMRGINGKS